MENSKLVKKGHGCLGSYPIEHRKLETGKKNNMFRSCLIKLNTLESFFTDALKSIYKYAIMIINRFAYNTIRIYLTY